MRPRRRRSGWRRATAGTRGSRGPVHARRRYRRCGRSAGPFGPGEPAGSEAADGHGTPVRSTPWIALIEVRSQWPASVSTDDCLTPTHGARFQAHTQCDGGERGTPAGARPRPVSACESLHSDCGSLARVGACLGHVTGGMSPAVVPATRLGLGARRSVMSHGVETGTIRTRIPARLDRLPWSRFHWIVMRGIGWAP